MKNKITIHLNKNSPWVHMELEFDISGIAGKLVKYLVYLSKKKRKKKRKEILLIGCPNTK
jgi:hypothetical protein